MTIKEWKNDMMELIKDFQFAQSAGDIEKLKNLVSEAEKISAWAARLLEEDLNHETIH